MIWENSDEFADVVSIIVWRDAVWADELAHLSGTDASENGCTQE
jgi:hypothetical protein